MLQPIKFSSRKLLEYSVQDWLSDYKWSSSSTRKWWNKKVRKKVKEILIDETELEDNEDYSE